MNVRKPTDYSAMFMALNELMAENLIGMDWADLRNMHRICGSDYGGKMHLLMDDTNHPGDVADPWYMDDFESARQYVLSGCCGLLDICKKRI